LVVPDPYWLSVLRVVVFGLATEREKRIAAQDVEIKEVRRQAAVISAKNGRLEGESVSCRKRTGSSPERDPAIPGVSR